jgi:hypothetical protein
MVIFEFGKWFCLGLLRRLRLDVGGLTPAPDLQ